MRTQKRKTIRSRDLSFVKGSINMFKPELPPLKTRIISYIAAVPIAFFIGLFYGLSPLVSAVVAAAFAVLFAAALFFELRSKRRDEEFRKAVQVFCYRITRPW